MPGEPHQHPRSLETRKELAILSCAADRLELEMAVERARADQHDVMGKFPRAWAWIEVAMDVFRQFSKMKEDGPITWRSFFKHAVGFFTEAA